MFIDRTYSNVVTDRANVLIITLFNILLLVDSLNGYCLDKGISFPISQALKILLLLLMSFQMLQQISSRIILWSILFYSVILILFFSFKVNFLYSQTFAHLFKFLLIPCSYFYFKNLIYSNPRLRYKQIIRILKVNTCVLVVNILLVLVGLGTKSYSDIGSKGYFYAANELSGLLLLFCPCILYYIGRKYTLSSIKYYVLIGIFLLTVLLLGTKSSIISYVISSFVVSRLLMNNKKSYLRLYLFGLVIAIIIIILGYRLLNSLGFWERWAFFYDKGGILLLLLSGREEYWLEEKSDLLEGGIGNIIMGLGEARTVEMDIFDTFLNYGIIGVTIIYSFFFYLLYRAYQKKNQNSWAKVVLFINVMLIIASSLSGHIVFSGMAGPFIALVNVLVLIPNKYIS
jgi:hypothetical protein